MFDSTLLKNPPKGINVQQAPDKITITIDGHFSCYSFYGVLILSIGVILAYVLFINTHNANAVSFIISLLFFIVGLVMLIFDFRTKITTTEIMIDAQNHIDISTHRNGKIAESAHMDHIEALACQELMLFRDGLIKIAPVHRIIPIICDDQKTFSIPKTTKAKWAWIQQLFSELIDLYDAQKEDHPGDTASAEEARLRAEFESEEE